MDKHSMCGANECDRKSVSKGYCDKHYRRLRKYGDANMIVRGHVAHKREDIPEDQRCAVIDCPKIKERRDWCRRHHRLWRINGDPLIDSSRDDSKPCSIDSCSDSVRIGEYCYAHYARFKRHGDPLAGGTTKAIAIDHADGDRTCSACETKKPIDAFHFAKLGRRNRRLMCAECSMVEAAERYKANKARYDAMALACRHARRATTSGGEADPGITRDRLRAIHGDDCMYCGTPMDFDHVGHKGVPNKATIEHIMPLAKGGSHTWDNTALACRRCNSSKGAKTPDEFAAYVEEVGSAWQRTETHTAMSSGAMR